MWRVSQVSSIIDYPRHVRALTTNSRVNLKISRVSARDTRASVKFELSCTVINTSQELDRFIMIPKSIFEYLVLATKEYSNTKYPIRLSPSVCT